MGKASLRWLPWLVMLGCDAELPAECTEADPGDLEGYCVLGDNDGRAAALDDIDSCAGLDEDRPRAEPTYVAEGPGSCGDEVDDEVLEAEQAAYEGCWREAYEASYVVPEETEC